VFILSILILRLEKIGEFVLDIDGGAGRHFFFVEVWEKINKIILGERKVDPTTKQTLMVYMQGHPGHKAIRC